MVQSQTEEGSMFDGFETHRVRVGETTFHLRLGGSGPAVLLLHGFPQTHLAFHKVAPALAQHFTVVVPDTPGYGESRGPAPTPEGFSKRALAGLCAGLMTELGHERFHLAGHDRGGRIGYRMALDLPERVKSFAILDIIPTLENWRRMDWRSALGGYHWLLLAQDDPAIRRMVGADAPAYVRHLIDRWAGHRDRLATDAVTAYCDAYWDPSVVDAMFADYRAGATIDMEHDEATRAAGDRISCPCVLLWATRYLKEMGESHLDVWRRWADDVSDIALDCGHFIVEEEPQACAAAMVDLFTRAEG
jgi:haloacetate dehalogenase